MIGCRPINDFKSLDKRVVVRDDILKFVRDPLTYQHILTKITSPCKIVEWAEGELDNFIVKVNAIDRVYYINGNIEDGESERDYTLLAQMRYGPKKAYFILSASKPSCGYCDYECHGFGRIYVTFDPKIFLNSIEHQSREIWTLVNQEM